MKKRKEPNWEKEKAKWTETTRGDGLKVRYHCVTPNGIIMQSGVCKALFTGELQAWWSVAHQTFFIPVGDTEHHLISADHSARMAMIALRRAAGMPDDETLSHPWGKVRPHEYYVKRNNQYRARAHRKAIREAEEMLKNPPTFEEAKAQVKRLKNGKQD